MDPRITNLESTTFFGRRLTRRQIAGIQKTAALLPGNSRTEMARTVCEHLDRRAPKGGHRVSACLRMLERLEGLGILTLPARRGAGADQAHGGLGPTAGDRLRPVRPRAPVAARRGRRRGEGGMERAGRPPPLPWLPAAVRSAPALVRP